MDIKVEHGLLKIDKQYYKVDYKDGREVLIKVNKKEIDKKTKIVKELAHKLKDNLDREIVMREALQQLSSKELQKLDKLIKSKRQYNPKTREGYCADMKIGNFVIPIVSNH